LNPARSFGPAAVSGVFPHYHWIYWVGPFLGSLTTAGYFRFVKYFNYGKLEIENPFLQQLLTRIQRRQTLARTTPAETSRTKGMSYCEERVRSISEKTLAIRVCVRIQRWSLWDLEGYPFCWVTRYHSHRL